MRLVSVTLIGTLTIAIALSVLAGSGVVAIPVLVAGPIAMSTIVRHRANRQRHLFDYFRETLQAQHVAIEFAHRLHLGGEKDDAGKFHQSGSPKT